MTGQVLQITLHCNNCGCEWVIESPPYSTVYRPKLPGLLWRKNTGRYVGDGNYVCEKCNKVPTETGEVKNGVH